MTLQGKTAIVTGAARGIGLGIAARLTAAGCRVAGWDLDPSPVLDADDLMIDHIQSADVTDSNSIATALRKTLSEFGQIDVLVNNAGVNGPTVPLWEYPPEDWQRVIDVDLTGVFLCCRAVVPHMRQRKQGRIVNIASVVGKEGNAFASAYSAAKAGVIGLTRGLAKELVGDNILVNCVTPAMVETDLLGEMTEDYIAMVKAKIPMGRLCSIREIADMVAWIAGPECTFTTGMAFDLSGGRATY